VDSVVVVEGCFVEIQDNLPLPEYAKKHEDVLMLQIISCYGNPPAYNKSLLVSRPENTT
jgi:hypothetical protein